MLLLPLMKQMRLGSLSGVPLPGADSENQVTVRQVHWGRSVTAGPEYPGGQISIGRGRTSALFTAISSPSGTSTLTYPLCL
jgi:hypothetical protein